MGAWILVIVVAVLMIAAIYFYLLRNFHKFKCLNRLKASHPKLSWLVAAIPLVGFTVAFAINITNTFVVLCHLLAFWLVCNLVGLIINKIRKTSLTEKKVYLAGIMAVVLTIGYLGYGWVAVHNVWETDYQLSNNGTGAKMRVLLISDSHLCNTIDGQGLADYLEEMQALEPDVVVFAGDLVDDGTDKADMEIAATALGSIKSTYGTYFAYGNHDRGYFNYRNFDADDLEAALRENGVTILQDSYVNLGDKVCLIGREDKSISDRKTVAQLMEGVDNSKYTIMLDHQPCDYEAQAAADLDLVLSGHTHGGQLWPIGQVSVLLNINDAYDGLTHIDNTDFIVSSGISDWEVKFKTGTYSEYDVIDIG